MRSCKYCGHWTAFVKLDPSLQGFQLMTTHPKGVCVSADLIHLLTTASDTSIPSKRQFNYQIDQKEVPLKFNITFVFEHINKTGQCYNAKWSNRRSIKYQYNKRASHADDIQ